MNAQNNDRQSLENPEATETSAAPKLLSPAAKRALEEAEKRRQAEKTQVLAPEIGGRGGADPARFGDWEIKGRAIDF